MNLDRLRWQSPAMRRRWRRRGKAPS